MVTEYEIKVLRMLNGEIDLPWGAAIGACIEFLQEDGYVTRGMRWQLTKTGKELLSSLDTPLDY